jgi:hypothetical protein
MLRDRLYDLTRSALINNEIKEFKQIVELLPKTRIALTIKANNNRINKCIEQPWEFTGAEIILLSDALKIDTAVLQKIIEKQFRKAGEHYQNG